jgi:hypothetical protein
VVRQLRKSGGRNQRSNTDLHRSPTLALLIFPFALSLSKGEWKNPTHKVNPFMLRQAQHERINLMTVMLERGLVNVELKT